MNVVLFLRQKLKLSVKTRKMTFKFMIHFHSPINFKLCPGHFNASWDLGNLFTSDTLYEVIDNVEGWSVSECYGRPIFIYFY